MSNNISITGMGTFSAGEYGNIVVSGVGTCTGRFVTAQQINVPGVMKFVGSELIKTDIFKCNGVCTATGKFKTSAGTIHGELKANELEAGAMVVYGVVKTIGSMDITSLELPGALKTEGDLRCGNAHITGKVRLGGQAKSSQMAVHGALDAASAVIRNLTVSGSFNVEQNITGGEVKGTGSIKAKNIEADSFSFSGGVNLTGQLSADTVDIWGAIYASEIVGDKVKIGRPNRKNPFNLRGWIHGKDGFDNRANLIEATRIELYHVKAEQVNGQDIVIGEKCQIDHVDCSGTLSIAPDAVVGQITGSYRVV